jgi:hypothetical protein
MICYVLFKYRAIFSALLWVYSFTFIDILFSSILFCAAQFSSVLLMKFVTLLYYINYAVLYLYIFCTTFLCSNSFLYIYYYYDYYYYFMYISLAFYIVRCCRRLFTDLSWRKSCSFLGQQMWNLWCKKWQWGKRGFECFIPIRWYVYRESIRAYCQQ